MEMLTGEKVRRARGGPRSIHSSIRLWRWTLTPQRVRRAVLMTVGGDGGGTSGKPKGFRRGRSCSGLVALLCLSALFGNVHAAVNPTDLNVLNQLGSAWGVNSLGWGNGDACTWPGVTCDATGTTVINLFLQTASISGTIPAAIGDFTGLLQLDLSYNIGLVGPIPPEIGKLTLLNSLIIQYCSLTGPVPSTIGNLKALTFIGLNNNFLTGTIPSSLGGLPLLYWFDLSTNNLTGQLPVSSTSADGLGLDTLANCQHFHFNNNSLSGPIPSELGAPPGGGPTKLTKLIHILLENNEFSGSIPASIANLPVLEILSFSNNRLSGPIPANISRLTVGANGNTTLLQILVGGNQLQGVIPNLTAITANLAVVEFSGNNFDPQPFPSWLATAPQLQTAYLEGTNLVGEFTSAVLSAPLLQTLWARNNSMNGTLRIPEVVGSNLQTVSLQQNKFSQVTQTNTSTNLTQIDLQVAGNPVCDATNVARPSALCDKASQSKQPWTSPYSTLASCPSVSSCPNSKSINPLVPGNCNCSLPLEMQLEARRPEFSVISDELMETLRVQLSTQLNLLPSQVWVTNAAFTSDGRCEIGVDFFSADGVSDLDPATTNNVTHSLTSNTLVLPSLKPYLARVLVDGATFLAKKKSSLGAGAIAGIVVGIVAALAAVGLYAFWQKRRVAKLKHIAQPFAKWGAGDGEKDMAAPMIAGTRFFPYSEVKKITNNFADSNEIGVGGYGKVYSGVLENGVKVAVKRAQEGSMQGAEEFKNEIELLSRVHHKNLVGLVGYCYEHGEQMLVYEFMVNGTMRDWLSGKMAYPLDWTKRLSIAVGSARGLAYLHELANPPIIHRDIKSQNILLDENHIAKVADFGLSKQAPEGADKLIVTEQVKGTLGYLDPEYYMTQHLSEKSDVYSFGVVLLELATSRAPIQNGKYIVREVREALAQSGGLPTTDALGALLDPSLHEPSEADLDRFIGLALSCVEEKGEDRPTMNEVVKELESLVKNSMPKAKASAQATDGSWLMDVYGGDEEAIAATGEGVTGTFKYSGGYSPGHPEPK